LSFEQKAATGAMSVLGIVRGNELDLNITAGGHTTTQQATVAETLEDAMATYRLAAHPEVGRSEKAQRFDASVLRLVSGEHRVVAVEQRMLGGVSTQTVQIESRYPDLGITESSWLDNSGTVLESRVGGFFVARLEPPDVAKQLDYSQDLLVSAVVAAPPSVAQGTNAVHMELDFRGFDDGPPPTSDRQKVAVQGDVVRISLTRDVAPTQALGGVDANDPMLATTPFIQSDHPAIRNKAREVAGDAKDLFTAVRRLTAFVFDHVRDEYVPAYSNALEALQTARGDCTEHSILFVALARALGIPARVAVGIAYWAPGNGFGWHAWAEVRAGARWIAVDPTWNQPIADVTHVKLADGGPAEQARIVMLLGRLRIVAARVNDG
jgi:transglutaminase-like putative cysteine protease